MRSLAASLLALVILVGPASAQPAAMEPSPARSEAVASPGSAGGVRAAELMGEADARRVHDISAQLRCVVCQALSVADSPSTTAQQMRALVLEQVRAGKSDEEILAYFVSRYGEWVLLAPPRRGFNLLAWWLPFVGITVGVLAVVLTARRWVANGRALRRSSAEAGATSPSPARQQADAPPSSADRQRLADELARLGR